MAYKTIQKKQTFIKTYRESWGNITKACKAAKISRDAYYKWIDQDPKFKKDCYNAMEQYYDLVEERLQKRSMEDSKVMMFFAKTKMKNRGYVERKEIETSGEVNNIMSFSKVYEECKEEGK